MKKHIIQDWLEISDYEVRSYTGRGMNRSCLAITNVSSQEFLKFILSRITEETNTKTFRAEVCNYLTDSLGKGNVLYFPNIPFYDDSENGDDNDD